MITSLKRVTLRLTVVIVAFGLPFLVAIIAAGHVPSSFEVTVLDAWSPLRSPGPSTTLLARGLTLLIEEEKSDLPPWFTDEHQNLLTKAREALTRNQLQEAMGQLMILNSQIEHHGQTLDDFLPIIVPDLATWIIAQYFAPLLLALVLVLVSLVIFAPWLAKRFYDFIKVLMTLIISLVVLIGGVSLCFTIAGHKALIFALIEYLVAALLLLLGGNLMVYWWTRQQEKPRLAPQMSSTHNNTTTEQQHKPAPYFAVIGDREFYRHLPPVPSTALVAMRLGDTQNIEPDIKKTQQEDGTKRFINLPLIEK